MSVAEWVTAVIAVVALGVSIGAFVYARRGTIAAEESASTAADALVENRRSADAAVAAAAAAERSADLADEALHPPAAAQLVIEKAGGSTWVLRNVGDAAAAGVRCADDVGGLFRLAPDLTLGPGAGETFMMAGAWGAPIPPQLHFVWEGQDVPVAVRVPLEDA
ncbi:hypothetical protein [Tsukamurella hominis]|uniref:hypothetical protein n=1 Tax=Tsukamurella hominis TaxID=1970232 RepID=UPI0039EBF1B1